MEHLPSSYKRFAPGGRDPAADRLGRRPVLPCPAWSAGPAGGAKGVASARRSNGGPVRFLVLRHTSGRGRSPLLLRGGSPMPSHPPGVVPLRVLVVDNCHYLTDILCRL